MFKNSQLLNVGKGVATVIFEAVLPALISILFLMSAVSMVWLLFVGEWRLVILGIIVGVIFTWVEPIIMLPAFGLGMAGIALRKKVFIIAFLFTLITIIYQQLVMVGYSFLVISNAVSYTNHYILSMLYGLSVVMGSLTYIASNDEGLGTTLGLLIALLSYIFLGIFWLTNGMPIFILILIVLVIAAICIQGVVTYKSLKTLETNQ